MNNTTAERIRTGHDLMISLTQLGGTFDEMIEQARLLGTLFTSIKDSISHDPLHADSIYRDVVTFAYRSLMATSTAQSNMNESVRQDLNSLRQAIEAGMLVLGDLNDAQAHIISMENELDEAHENMKEVEVYMSDARDRLQDARDRRAEDVDRHAALTASHDADQIHIEALRTESAARRTLCEERARLLVLERDHSTQQTRLLENALERVATLEETVKTLTAPQEPRKKSKRK